MCLADLRKHEHGNNQSFLGIFMFKKMKMRSRETTSVKLTLNDFYFNHKKR